MHISKPQDRIVNGPIRYHLLFWGVVFSVVFFASLAADASPEFALGLSLSVVLLLPIPVYLHFYLLQRFFNRRGYILYGAITVAVIAGFALLFYAYFSRLFGTKNNIIQWMADIIFALIITTAIKIVKGEARQRLVMQEIKAKQLQTELNLLKSQINPHFLFNALNNIFSKALEHGDHAVADSISHLSHLLRYMIYDSSADTVPLDKEIAHVRRFIELQRLRFSEEDDVRIDFSVEGRLDGIEVPPMLLAPFVENAFKHGIDPSKPSAVSIQLSLNGRQLAFEIENTVHERTKRDEKGEAGIGLANVRRRLELLYPGTHELTIQHDRHAYRVRLLLQVSESP